jgi:cytochrome b561
MPKVEKATCGDSMQELSDRTRATAAGPRPTAADRRYGRVAMALHWLIAASILSLLALGAIMTDLPRGPEKFQLYQIHKSLGITVLALSVLRLGWRLGHPPPPLPGTLAGWERRAARGAHVAFYVLMIGLPVSGWMMVSASPWNIPTQPWGLFTLPHLPWFATYPDKEALEGVMKAVHETAAWLMAGLILLHVAAALRHHLWLRDTVLLRMLPGRTPLADGRAPGRNQ